MYQPRVLPENQHTFHAEQLAECSWHESCLKTIWTIKSIVWVHLNQFLPHFEATFTIMQTFPLYFSRETSFPSISIAEKSYIDVADFQSAFPLPSACKSLKNISIKHQELLCFFIGWEDKPWLNSSANQRMTLIPQEPDGDILKRVR